jgi:hypothetical protein
MDFGAYPHDSRAGIVVMGLKHAALAVETNDIGARRLVLLIDGTESAATDVAGNVPIRLRVEMRAGGVCTFAHARDGDGDFTPIGDEFHAVEGKWIGAKVGVFCVTACAKPVTGHADFDYFRFSAAR